MNIPVKIFQNIPDKTQEKVQLQPGHWGHPLVRTQIDTGIMIGIGVNFEELGNYEQRYTGHYSTAIVFSDTTNKLEWYDLIQIERMEGVQ